MNDADRDDVGAHAASALRALLAALERDAALYRADGLHRRSDALDRLDRELLRVDTASEPGLHARAVALQARLDGLDQTLFDAIRARIRAGDGARALREAAAEAIAGESREPARGAGYDSLDMLVAGVLRIDEPAAAIDALAPDMVFYQPTPARLIFDLIARLALDEDDAVIDLGSGLGHVPLLLSICTPARCVGIELQAAYVDCARRCADALGLERVAFVHRDARAAALSAASVFYLYTPFGGALLREMLGRLRQEATTRRIRLCTLGPCTETIAEEPWLRTDDALVTDRIVLFESC